MPKPAYLLLPAMFLAASVAQAADKPAGVPSGALHALVTVKKVEPTFYAPGGTHVSMEGMIEQVYENAPVGPAAKASMPVRLDISCGAALPPPNPSPPCEPFQTAGQVEVWGTMGNDGKTLIVYSATPR